MGDFTDENDGIIQESRFLKVQIVDGGRRDPALGMGGSPRFLPARRSS